MARRPDLATRNRAVRGGKFLYEDAAWLCDAYLTRRLTLRQIAVEGDCALRTVARWMAIHGIPCRAGTDYPKPRGSAHPGWRGARVCPNCGGRKSWGGTQVCAKCRDRRGENNPKWRGGAAEYTAIHARLRAIKGNPSAHACASCGQPAAEWAYDHADPDEQRNEVGRDDGPYSLDPGHYLPLCVRCHRRFDLAR